MRYSATTAMFIPSAAANTVTVVAENAKEIPELSADVTRLAIIVAPAPDAKAINDANFG
ncbi:hypothetical protein CNEO4_1590007 [Clostridium neonatale]|nr:hypothetical protein CNEO4_1200006 [Clostridium neonatale]CAI3555300.1 hypothetical protein CNEO3_110016 [Clostridium neonatale]CAI3616931.1 hypothetical protein CNEO4_1590007 [Clostridium neonatale]CAI3640698.1 hypothetical protein CNEO4_370157 [Clostridium neonatale]CAI3676847.1 hypothetical protein CNEO4_540046 [Clostridium neonatale]